MTESALFQPPLSSHSVASTTMDNGPDPTKNSSRSILLSLNLCLAVLFAIFVILGIGAIRTVKADSDQKTRVEFCERWDQDFPDFPTPEGCR